MRSRTATTVMTYALLCLAGGLSFALPESVSVPSLSAEAHAPRRAFVPGALNAVPDAPELIALGGNDLTWSAFAASLGPRAGDARHSILLTEYGTIFRTKVEDLDPPQAPDGDFAYTIHGRFVYLDGDRQFFEFQGGSASWIFIDDTCVLVRTPETATTASMIALDALAATLPEPLVPGIPYEIRFVMLEEEAARHDFFFATNSAFRIYDPDEPQTAQEQ